MLQLILHGIGDYWLQTDDQAIGKKMSGAYGNMMCFRHCLTYSLPFLLIGSWLAVLVIFITHYIVDRTRLLEWAIAKKNGVDHINNFGFDDRKPFAMAVWLFIIMDNIVHITCNYFALMYL